MMILPGFLSAPRSAYLHHGSLLWPSRSICCRATCGHVVSFASVEEVGKGDGVPGVRTTETLPSGRQVKKLEGFKTRRTLADLPAGLVEQLVKDNISMKPPVKMGIRGVTKQVAEDVRKRWNKRDVVKMWAEHKSVKGDMKATAAELERLTGGLVIWRSGAKLLIYKDPEGQKDWTPPWQQTLGGTDNDDSDSDSDDESNKEDPWKK